MKSASLGWMRVGSLAVMSAIALTSTACGANPGDDSVGATADELRVTSSFVSKGTGYFPDSSLLEGGFVDRRGKPLRTLQQFLAGNAEYVSVAMDTNAFKYGTRLRIRELDAKHGRAIIFRVVDTGGAFKNKGRARIDICTQNTKASLDPTINGTLHIDVIDETSGGSLDPIDTPDEPATKTPAPTPPPTEGGGTPCSGDGQCNPGSNGSGMICTAGRCVKGCRQNSQCPGSQSCNTGGQCE